MKTVAFSHATTSSLLQKGTINMEYLSCFSNSDVYGWISTGDRLEIFNKYDGTRISSAVFGTRMKSKHNTLITAVCQCTKSSRFIVATVTDDPYITGSLICLFNARTSIIEKVVAAPYEITSVEYLNDFCTSSIGHSSFSERLKCFDGIIALGTYNGHTCLMDLKLGKQSCSSESSPGKMVSDKGTTRQVPNDQHVAIWLGGDSKLEKVKNSDLYVSALKYIQKTSLLAVGFSNGMMELWDLKSLDLVFSNFIAEIRKGILISHFAFQEPENDPKNVCYLWVFYTPTQGSPRSVGQAFLLQMIFHDRSFEGEMGYTYSGFTNAFLRFSHPLCSNFDSPFMAPIKILSCSCLSSGSINEEGSCNGEDLMVVVWQELKQNREAQLYLLAFDLNQWYHCQMPSSLDSRNFMSSSDFVVVHPLTELEKHKNVLQVKVEGRATKSNEDSNCVLPFLDFEMKAITLSGLVSGGVLNYTMQISHEIERCQNSLFDKASYYDVCFKLRKHFKDDLNPTSVTETNEHFALLSVILDSGFVGAMISIIRQLACAHLRGVESFLTLEHIVEWSKQKLLSIKKTFNRLVIPLLKLGSAQCDNQSSIGYKKCKNSVHWLLTILLELTDAADVLSDAVQQQLFPCVSLAMHIKKFIDASYWILNADPIYFCHGAMNDANFSGLLLEYYSIKRRHLERRKLNIDFMMSYGGSSIIKHFESLSQTSNYPPSNLETLLGLFLLPDVCMESKYFISLYFLNDLLSDASEETRSSMLSNFASQMNIRKSFVHLVRASWLLDHNEYKESYQILQYLEKDNCLHSSFYVNMVKAFLEAEKADVTLILSKRFLLQEVKEDECCVLLEALATKGKIDDAYKSLGRALTKSSDYFAETVVKCGRGGFLKEVLKVPMISDTKGRTYFEAFNSVTKTSVNEELFNQSNMKGRKLRKSMISAKDKHLLQGNYSQLSSNCTNSKRSREAVRNHDTTVTLSSSNGANEPSIEEGNMAEEVFLQPRSFGNNDLVFLEIPLPNKEIFPKASVVSHPSILYKPRSGDSVSTSKQLRFAEPELSIFHFVDDEIKPPSQSDTCKESSLSTLIEEVSDNGEESENEEDQNFMACEQGLGEVHLIETLTEEAPEQNETEPEGDIIATDLTKHEDFLMLGEAIGELPSVDEKTEDSDQMSVCTNEISEVESCQSEVTEDSLKRPPLKRSKKSRGQSPSIPARRSSRLSILTSTQQTTDQQQSEKPAKRIRMEDSNLDESYFKPRDRSNSSDDLKKKNPTISTEISTPEKVVGLRHSARVAKRFRAEDEDIATVKKTKLDESVLKTPTKSVALKESTVNRTPKSAQKSSRVNGDKIIDKQDSPPKDIPKEETPTAGFEKALLNEGPLTPAQKSIRMKRLLREQSDKNVKDVKPVDHVDESRLNELSKSIMQSDEQDAPVNESSKKTSFVFSPPLTRSKKRRGEHLSTE